MWLLNNNSKVGHIVYMRSNVIFDDLSPHLRLVGEAKHVQKIVVRKIISVDVLSWTITRISPDADNPRFQSVTMAAKDFRHNNLKVDLHDVRCLRRGGRQTRCLACTLYDASRGRQRLAGLARKHITC